MSASTELVYHCAPDIVWVKDADQTILVQEGTGRSWLLSSWQATVWDLLSLGYLADEIVYFLALLLEVPPETARDRLLPIINEWQVNGVLCDAAGGRCG